MDFYKQSYLQPHLRWRYVIWLKFTVLNILKKPTTTLMEVILLQQQQRKDWLLFQVSFHTFYTRFYWKIKFLMLRFTHMQTLSENTSRRKFSLRIFHFRCVSQPVSCLFVVPIASYIHAFCLALCPFFPMEAFKTKWGATITPSFTI